MKLETFKAIDTAARCAVYEARVQFIADCRLRTIDTLLLAGFDHIEAMVNHKWKTKNMAAFKALSKRSKRASQQRTLAAGANNRRANWTEQDEVKIMTSTDKDEVLAISLGRTLKGVRQKRNRLRKAFEATL